MTMIFKATIDDVRRDGMKNLLPRHKFHFRPSS